MVTSSREDRRSFLLFAGALFLGTILNFVNAIIVPFGYAIFRAYRSPMGVWSAALMILVMGALFLWWLLSSEEITADRDRLEIRDGPNTRVVPLAKVGGVATIPLWRFVRVAWLVGLRVPKADSPSMTTIWGWFTSDAKRELIQLLKERPRL